MSEHTEHKVSIPLAVVCSVAITIAGWGVTFGVFQNKIETNTRDLQRVEKQHTADIERISNRQDNTEALLQAINSQLVELNTKMTLLLQGNLKTSE